jgi:N-acetylated-alpha-linked acidic dipeptidase
VEAVKDTYSDEALERAARETVSLDETRGLLERFVTLTRESGTADERAAADYLVGRLRALGVAVTVLEPELFLSVPRRSELRLRHEDRPIASRTPAFSRSTDGAEVTGEIIHVPSQYAAGVSSFYETPASALGGGGSGDPVAGRIVITEGFSTPGPVHAFERRGAIGEIFIHPGERIHAGICTTIWGAPTADSISRKPQIPVVCVNQPDGQRLVALAQNGGARATLRTWLEEGWARCPLPVADIRGTEDPDEFLLVHGHYDSWDVGIGDNATGDATLLEIARVLHGLRGRLKRSVRIAWWPGHSTGRYAGSTWYADTFADEIDEWCVAQINIDSPGCAGATAYEEVMWMAEAGPFCTSAIRDAVGAPSQRMRPLRAGDYSFNQIGPTGLYMLMSNIPIEERKRRGYYAVGGCGGNIAWHTPFDVMDVADATIVERDLNVYITSILRLLNAPVYPFDYSAAIDEMTVAIDKYHQAGSGEIDLTPLLEDLRRLRARYVAWREGADADVRRDPSNAERRRAVNAVLRRLARILVPMNYARGERFDHDPAIKLGVVPRLEGALRLVDAGPDAKPFLRTGLVRERNKLRAMIRAAMRELS